MKRSTSVFIRVLIILAAIAGLALLLYPTYTDWNEKRQQELLKSTLKEKTAVDTKSKEKNAVPEVPEGAWGLLIIPSLKIEAAVVNGVSEEDLKKGPGWYPMTALPGKGNTAIAGHRTMYGGVFRDIATLDKGDEILLVYQGKTYKYLVDRIFTVSSKDWSIIQPVGHPVLTLTTCYPNTPTKRVVVRADLVESSKSQIPERRQ